MAAHLARWLAATSTAVLLAACGGGEADHTAPLTNRRAALDASPPEVPVPVNALFDWAESAYPQFFPKHQATLVSAPYEYRHYSDSGNYLGVAGNDVYVFGPISQQQLLRVGSREDFRCRVQPQTCIDIYPRAGHTAKLSSLAHGVAGTVTIVDARTIRITGFRYDGTGPLVYVYLGRDNSFAAFNSGRAIGAVLQRRPYVDETIDVQLPEGQTLDGFTAVSIWCVEFKVNFGSGTLAVPVN